MIPIFRSFLIDFQKKTINLNYLLARPVIIKIFTKQFTKLKYFASNFLLFLYCFHLNPKFIIKVIKKVKSLKMILYSYEYQFKTSINSYHNYNMSWIRGMSKFFYEKQEFLCLKKKQTTFVFQPPLMQFKQTFLFLHHFIKNFNITFYLDFSNYKLKSRSFYLIFYWILFTFQK